MFFDSQCRTYHHFRSNRMSSSGCDVKNSYWHQTSAWFIDLIGILISLCNWSVFHPPILPTNFTCRFWLLTAHLENLADAARVGRLASWCMAMSCKSPDLRGNGCESNQSGGQISGKKMKVFEKWATKKKTTALTFRLNPGCLIGILKMVYCTPQITAKHDYPLYTLPVSCIAQPKKKTSPNNQRLDSSKIAGFCLESLVHHHFTWDLGWFLGF